MPDAVRTKVRFAALEGDALDERQIRLRNTVCAQLQLRSGTGGRFQLSTGRVTGGGSHVTDEVDSEETVAILAVGKAALSPRGESIISHPAKWQPITAEVV